MDAAKNRAQYIAWLRSNFPQLYSDVIRSMRGEFRQRQLSGFFDSVGSAFTSFVDNVTKSLPQLAQTYTQYEAQKDLLRVNTQRAQQGLAPLQYNAQGQLITSGGLPYTAEDFQIAQRGYSGMDQTTMIALVVGFVLLLIFLTRGKS